MTTVFTAQGRTTSRPRRLRDPLGVPRRADRRGPARIIKQGLGHRHDAGRAPLAPRRHLGGEVLAERHVRFLRVRAPLPLAAPRPAYLAVVVTPGRGRRLGLDRRAVRARRPGRHPPGRRLVGPVPTNQTITSLQSGGAGTWTWSVLTGSSSCSASAGQERIADTYVTIVGPRRHWRSHAAQQLAFLGVPQVRPHRRRPRDEIEPQPAHRHAAGRRCCNRRPRS